MQNPDKVDEIGNEAKKYALELDMNYTEFPPMHYKWNMHCKLPASQYDR